MPITSAVLGPSRRTRPVSADLADDDPPRHGQQAVDLAQRRVDLDRVEEGEDPAQEGDIEGAVEVREPGDVAGHERRPRSDAHCLCEAAGHFNDRPPVQLSQRENPRPARNRSCSATGPACMCPPPGPCRWHRWEAGLGPSEDWAALLEEGPDPLLVVVAVIHLAAERLDALIGLRREWVGVRQDPQLLFHDAVDER